MLFGGPDERIPKNLKFLSVEDSIRAWVKANGCKEDPTTDELPDKAKDGTKVTRKTYGSGKDGSEVVLVIIEGGGAHPFGYARGWPKVSLHTIYGVVQIWFEPMALTSIGAPYHKGKHSGRH